MTERVRGGQVAYEAYARTTGNKTYDGREMPVWGQLTELIKDAWDAAALAVQASGVRGEH